MVISQKRYQPLDAHGEAYIRHCGRKGLPAVWIGFGMLQRHKAEEMGGVNMRQSRLRNECVDMLFLGLFSASVESERNASVPWRLNEGGKAREFEVRSTLQTAMLSDVVCTLAVLW